MTTRRQMLKSLASMPLLGGALGATMIGTVGCAHIASGASAGRRDLFRELGIRPFINGRGTLTYLSGSLMLPEVLEAINSSAKQFADLNEVQDKVGARIAQLLRCEAAMVTSGAACAMTLGTAAAITGTDPEKIRQIPDLPEPRPEVIIQRSHRFAYDHAVRNTGAKLVEVEGREEMERAINENTVMMLYFNAAGRSSVEREEFVAIGKRHGVVTFNDAAADVPPVENLFRYIEMGFDLVTFSGGKAIRGPQSAGLLYGRRDLIAAARLNHSPNGDTIGRAMKVNKEEMFGMLVALELYLSKDHEQEWADWIGRTRRIAASAERIPSVQGETTINPGPANHFPGLRLTWDQNRVRITPREVADTLRNGEPSIDLGAGNDALTISVVMMEPDHVDIVARRVHEVLARAV